jgi:SAM-dependent methyltransferase
MFDFVRKPLLWKAWDAGLDEEVLDIGEYRTRRQLLSQNVHTFQLKSMQDLAVYVQLRGLSGKQIAEVGAGNSRLLPRLAQANTCVAVEKYEGEGGGPTTASPIPGVRIVPVFLGEKSPLLATESFDVVFSISVVEHVPTEDLAAFHEDQLRILKPGGLFIHAIDIYLEDEPATHPVTTHHVRRFDVYRSWVTSSKDVRPVGPIFRGACRFTCDLVTNPDNVMYAWGRVAPKLIELRQAAQVASLLVAGRKLGRTSQQEGGGDVRGSVVP